MNRTQGAALGFFVVIWLVVVGIFVAAPDVYDQALRFPPGSRPAELAFLAALSALVALLAAGILRRWRWIFWLIMIAFIGGALRVPASVLQLGGYLPADAPTWYVVLQGLIGLVQFALGVGMLIGYRRGGVWGAF